MKLVDWVLKRNESDQAHTKTPSDTAASSSEEKVYNTVRQEVSASQKKNAPHDGLGSNPLGEEDPLAKTLYASSTKTTRNKAGRKPPKEGQNWRLVTFSFYEEDVQL